MTSLIAVAAAAQNDTIDNRFLLGAVTVTAQRVDEVDPVIVQISGSTRAEVRLTLTQPGL